MAEIKLADLSAEEREKLLKQAQEEVSNKQMKEQQERKTYKELVNETIEDVFPTLIAMSGNLKATKDKVYNNFKKVLELKKDLFGVSNEQATHTFTNEEGTKRITIGYRTNDAYDDTVEEGISMVKGYIGSLATDDKSEKLVKIINQLLSRDQKGNLKASRVLQLTKYAQESDNDLFTEGVKIIQQAYKPEKTKTFIQCQMKDKEGSWFSIPLSMTDN
jgi:hypothetical protein